MKDATKLTPLKDNHIVDVQTDASEEFWTEFVTQYDEVGADKEIHKRKHEPIAFLGGQFIGTQKDWTT